MIFFLFLFLNEYKEKLQKEHKENNEFTGWWMGYVFE